MIPQDQDYAISLSLKKEKTKCNEIMVKEWEAEVVRRLEEQLEGVSKECGNKDLLHNIIE